MRPGMKLVLAVCAALAVGFWLWIESASRAQAERQRQAALTPEPVAAREAPPPPKEPTLVDRTLAVGTLAEAIPLALPIMADVSDGTSSPGALLLAAWMSQHDAKAELMKMPATSRAEVLKDSDAVRGRRLCAQGSIVEIARDKSLPFQGYTGGIRQGYDIYRFIAVGSSEGVLEGKWARICGITPGTYSYANSGGGVTHAVEIVGAFDLKARPPEY